MPGKTYELVYGDKIDQWGIKCLRCGKTSWHSVDVEKRYCANCHEFHVQHDHMLPYGMMDQIEGD